MFDDASLLCNSLTEFLIDPKVPCSVHIFCGCDGKQVWSYSHCPRANCGPLVSFKWPARKWKIKCNMSCCCINLILLVHVYCSSVSARSVIIVDIGYRPSCALAPACLDFMICGLQTEMFGHPGVKQCMND